MQTFSRKCGLSQPLPAAILTEIDKSHGTKVPDPQLFARNPGFVLASEVCQKL